ncbi:adenine phosphoribosyltransferase [Mycoplasma sp. Mirounga ES2805-ORL]|uniref:adenine phosphoribosyltransferase n=1 Tax=Mycoplasma sp. Mirounga ES2805-ORL TaxID=754514 RepID=UPI00197C126D|nr:adenine phosphoribosyltransferase [Mycoplasma sp. Mirounga ES2805-ORL]QSF13568.1 adenine phosphoribosyltransferase [Mycoplasma sp. Mirounga ES2805-ORL]
MDISKFIKNIPDFPKEGIAFKDICPLLANGEAFNYTINKMAELCKTADVIVAPDARGFIFGSPVAFLLKKPFIMVRKPGKLPGEKFIESYELEYGVNTLEMQKDLIKPNQKVAIIDDVLATSGTIKAIINLVEKQGAKIDKVVQLLELTKLKGRQILEDKGIEVHSLIKV